MRIAKFEGDRAGNQSIFVGKLIAAINITIDGFCDHTAGIADEEIHDYYSELLNRSQAILYGKTTFLLMKYWQRFLDNSSGEKSIDEFAIAIDRIPKIVFSNTLKDTEWNSAVLSGKAPEEEVAQLKAHVDGDILVGSRSLIVQLTNLNLIDEYQFCIHPVVTGKGLNVLDGLRDRTIFKLIDTKIFRSGALLLIYART